MDTKTEQNLRFEFNQLSGLIFILQEVRDFLVKYPESSLPIARLNILADSVYVTIKYLHTIQAGIEEQLAHS